LREDLRKTNPDNTTLDVGISGLKICS